MMKLSMLLLLPLLVALVALSPAPAGALLITFQNGVDGYAGADNESHSFDGITSNDVIRIDLPGAGQAGSYAWLIFEDIFGADAIPPGHEVLHAVLEGWVLNPFGSATVTRLLDDIANRPLAPARIDDPGIAGTFYDDAQNASAPHAPGCATISSCDPPVPVSWDVTDIVRAWAGGAGNHGFLILPDTTNGGNLAGADHPTGSLRPRLVVTVAPEPGTAALLALALLALAARSPRDG